MRSLIDGLRPKTPLANQKWAVGLLVDFAGDSVSGALGHRSGGAVCRYRTVVKSQVLMKPGHCWC